MKVSDLSKTIFLLFKEHDKVDSIFVVFGSSPITLSCCRMDILNTAVFLHVISIKYQPYQQPLQWKSCPGTSSLFIFGKCVCVHAWFLYLWIILLSLGKLFISTKLFAYTIIAVRPEMQMVEDGVHRERFNIEEKIGSCLCDSIASAHFWKFV